MFRLAMADCERVFGAEHCEALIYSCRPDPALDAQLRRCRPTFRALRAYQDNLGAVIRQFSHLS
jgi:hypothetical protein